MIKEKNKEKGRNLAANNDQAYDQSQNSTEKPKTQRPDHKDQTIRKAAQEATQKDIEAGESPA